MDLAVQGRERHCARWFWAWQENRETDWLEGMSRQGWHLESFALFLYRFRKGEPREYLYRLDFAPVGPRGDCDEYLRLFHDAGWEHVCRYGPWLYFRGLKEQVLSTEIHTDRESRIAKYRRLLTTLVLIAVALLVTTLSAPPLKELPALFVILRVLRYLLVGLLAYAVVRVLILVRKLRR